MQQPNHPLTPMPPFPPTSITTEQIQKYLDENKQLILAILDNQNLGKLAECAQYQAQLQKNLLYLAAIADAQPQQTPTARPQMLPHAAIQGGHYMQQQPPIFPTKASMQVNPQQMMQQQHHQPQMLSLQGHMGVRPGMNNGMHADATLGGSSDMPPAPSLADFPRGSTPSTSADGRESKQDVAAASETASADGHRSNRSLPTDQGSGDVNPAHHRKRPQDAKTP